MSEAKPSRSCPVSSIPPLPHLPPHEQVQFSLIESFADYRDSDLRPLGELRAAPHLQTEIETERKTCPYPGGRKGHPHPMNVSALQQTRGHWDGFVEGLEYLRRCHVRRTGRERFTLEDLWKLGRVAAVLPSYLFWRAGNPISDTQMSPAVASIFKAMIGVNAAVEQFASQKMAMGEYDEDTTSSPEEIHDFAEEHGLMIGPREVCAAPRSMVLETLRAMAEGKPGVACEELSALLPDVDRFFDFGDQAVVLYLVRQLYFILLRSSFDTIDARLRELGADPAALAQAVARPGLGPKNPVDFSLWDRLTPEQRDTLMASVGQVIGRLVTPRQEQIAHLLFPMDGEQAQARGQRVLSFLHETNALPGADPRRHGELLAALMDYLDMEQQATRVFAGIQDDFNQPLGRPSNSRELRGEDITQAFGITPRDVVSHHLGITIAVTPNTLTLHRGEARLVL